MRPNFVRRVRREREVPLSSKIEQLIIVVSSIIVGAYFGAIVGMLLAFSCAYFSVITNAALLFPIMSTTAVIGAIVAVTAAMLELI